MLLRVLVVAALAMALLVAVKNGHILKTTGLTGTCLVARTNADGTQLEACRAGKLQGKPDLSADGCKDVGAQGPYEYWHCPAAVASQANGH
jgi:hypothetical protein